MLKNLFLQLSVALVALHIPTVGWAASKAAERKHILSYKELKTELSDMYVNGCTTFLGHERNGDELRVWNFQERSCDVRLLCYGSLEYKRLENKMFVFSNDFNTYSASIFDDYLLLFREKIEQSGSWGGAKSSVLALKSLGVTPEDCFKMLFDASKTYRWHSEGPYAGFQVFKTKEQKKAWCEQYKARSGEELQLCRNVPRGWVLQDSWIWEDLWKLERKYISGQLIKLHSMSPLHQKFDETSKENREFVQTFLASLGYYKSTIDGLYGVATKAALSTYNKKYFGSVDLSKKENVDALFDAILTNKVRQVKEGVKAEQDEKNQCSNLNLAHCTSQEFCSIGTQKVSGQLQWVSNTFADAAKKKGYSCNVAEIKKPVSCSSNPTACRDDEICALATKTDSGVVQWQNNPKLRAHIDAAKTRGLECGVLEGIAAVTVAFESGKYNTAFELSQVLAVQGNADAQFYLGKMYEEGLGALQISTLAHMWFNISALNGNEEAPERRKVIQQSMTPAAVEKAQTMALSCIQSRYVDCGAVMPVAPKVKTQQVQKPTRVEPTSSELRAYFVSQSLTERKQIQYALKQLGYYGSSVDGLWGKGTNRALVNYVSNERDITLPSAIYPSLIAKVEVPSRFATVKKKVVQQKPVSTANLSRDGKKCVSNGFSPGTQEYLQCLSYEQQRRQNQSNMLLNLGQGLLQTPSFPAPSTGGLNGGVFCNTMGNYTYCN